MLQAMPGAAGVGVEQGVEVGIGELDKRLGDVGRGDIGGHGKAAVGRDGGFYGGGDLVVPGDIGLDEMTGPARRRALGGDFLAEIGAAADERDVGATLGQQ